MSENNENLLYFPEQIKEEKNLENLSVEYIDKLHAKELEIKNKELQNGLLKLQKSEKQYCHKVSPSDRNKEDILYHLVKMEELVANISTRFINVNPKDLEEVIRSTLKEIGEFIDVDRSFLYFYSGDRTETVKGYEWYRHGIEPMVQKFLDISLKPYFWAMGIIRDMKPVYASNSSELPLKEKALKEFWAKSKIKSFLSVPLYIRKKLIGTLGFLMERKEKIWQESDIRILNMAGEIFVNLLERQRTEAELNEYRKHLNAIFSSIKDGIISVDKNLNIIECNEAAKTICNIFSVPSIKSLKNTGCNSKECLKALKKTLKTKETSELYRIECHCNTRPSQIVTVTITPLINGDNEDGGAVMVIKDETELVETDRMLQKRGQYHNITGKSKKMQEIYSFLEKLASIPSTVLITGESGTGKELIAEAIHYKGNRKNNPLVKVNCAALTETLLESELFGHVKGAFTGAIKDKTGWFEKAHRGTIFLDEIGDITPALQLRLLRFLQEKEFVPVGSTKTVKVDARVIVSTNQDIERKVKEGTFREDLYYRIKVAEIKLTPLRERQEDIPLLVEHFIKKYNREFNKTITGISQDVEKILMTYHWPGNIRELEHTIEHAFILTGQTVIMVNDLPDELKKFSLKEKKHKTGDEALELKEVLKKTNWKKAKAARLLGMDRKTIYRKMKKYNIPLEKQSENI